ncbi:MAG: MerR family DNA-binding protein [Deltaproteobacteria bacterium]|nr:MerR family DNA-binding protein [Deltaproteobacteria bacterium]
MKFMTTGKVSKQTGVGVETVRFYEKSGLIDKPPRTESGYRQYPASTVIRIRFIKRAKELGFTLREIKELLNLRLDPMTTCDDVRQVAEEKLRNVRAKIQSLQGIEKGLSELIGVCAVGGPDGECPILEALGPDWHPSEQIRDRIMPKSTKNVEV